MLKRAFLGLAILLVTSVASAELSVSEYKQAKANGGVDWNSVQMYIAGIGTAYLVANVDLKTKHQPKLYCQPEKLTVETSNYVEILDKVIAERTPYETVPIAIVLLKGLQDTFPCSPQ